MKSILVRSPNWIGDQVLAYPFFYFLRKRFPDAHIAAVCVEWVEDLQFRDLVDEVQVLPRAVTGSTWEKIRHLNESAARLREGRRWDLGISLPNSLSAAWLLKRSGAERRRGYRVEGRGILLNDAVEWDPSPERHRAQAYLDLLPTDARPSFAAREFWGLPPEEEFADPTPGELEKFDVATSWPTAKTLEPPVGDYWVLAPGATAESRRWPLEYFSRLVQIVSTATGMKALVVGGPKEAPIAQQIAEHQRSKVVDFTARGSVSGLSQVFARAKFTVTNESGLAHVAALCGSPVQIVCGAADPRRTRPIGPGLVQVAINPVDCWPCERNTCMQPADQKIICLKGIRPDVVWEEIKRGFVERRKRSI